MADGSRFFKAHVRRLIQLLSGLVSEPKEAVRVAGFTGLSTEAAMELGERDPRHHTRKVEQRLRETIDHLREDIDKIDEPKAKAMFETSAEVLGGLVKAFHDYDEKTESAWRS
jgi:hypothetical protein